MVRGKYKKHYEVNSLDLLNGPGRSVRPPSSQTSKKFSRVLLLSWGPRPQSEGVDIVSFDCFYLAVV